MKKILGWIQVWTLSLNPPLLRVNTVSILVRSQQHVTIQYFLRNYTHTPLIFKHNLRFISVNTIYYFICGSNKLINFNSIFKTVNFLSFH